MTFGRTRVPFEYTYLVSGVPLKRVNTVTDLGVKFDPALNFHGHIMDIANASYFRLGFVLRNARPFREPTTARLLYTFLVRSKLEYCSLIWSPHEALYSLMIERVQKRFLRFLYMKVYGYYPYLYPTAFLLGMLEFNSLEVRRNVHLVRFVFDLLRGRIIVPDLLSSIFIRVPANYVRGRHHDLLAISLARTNLFREAPLSRAARFINAITSSRHECDIFFMPESTFEKMVMEFF